ncbi:MAG: helix-hairpin-helix domain-containing protein [Bacteroidia bacterium]|nr:helix-hairpin-helix domain-containing protein [Bacteroidia bacterium]MCX7651807.1 helix-hairpin-helix domain-containing protein [Bacteroidia bacterium]MDW8417091.1 helix-hairpin-helix domain-containing protein [Bacteroidia bacterium]
MAKATFDFWLKSLKMLNMPKGLSPAQKASFQRRLRNSPSWWSFVGWGSLVILFSLIDFYHRLRVSPGLPSPKLVEVNTADSLVLLSLPGLSPWKVSRLLYLRREIGGFWDTNEVRLAVDSFYWARISSEVVVHRQGGPPRAIDLNSADSMGLVQARLCRPSVARSFIRYRYKVGGFQSWAQIDSFRGLNVVERYRFKTYGYLGSVEKSGTFIEPRTYQPLDLNSATAEQLEKLPGIGRKSAEKIVSYREKLGGYFVSTEQLREIWGVRPENIEKALPYLHIGSTPKPKLSLRYASVEELAAHPYISWRLARHLVRQRKDWGEQPIPPEVWVKWLPDSIRTKLIPYLTGE